MKVRKQLSADELFTWAVKKLGGRAVSVAELRLSLLDRAGKSSDVDGVLGRLKDYGYLNDVRFAESFASARLENEGLGKSRVLRDLRRRRVSPELAQKTVSQVYAGKDEPALIEQYLQRKYRLADRETVFQTNQELAKAYARLLRAGFSGANSIRVLKRFAADPGLLDSFEEAPPEIEEGDRE